MVTVQLDPETMATEGVRRPRYSDTVQVPVTRLQPVRSEVNIYGIHDKIFLITVLYFYTPRNEVRGGYTGITLSVRPSFRL